MSLTTLLKRSCDRTLLWAIGLPGLELMIPVIAVSKKLGFHHRVLAISVTAPKRKSHTPIAVSITCPEKRMQHD